MFIESDSLALFGHQCPACKGYWRSKAVPASRDLTCPYCGTSAETHQFLTPGQRRFVRAVCELTMRAARADADGKHVIDMDQVADEVAKTSERPSFYYTEETQQNHYTWAACGAADDILGRYGYCSCCGTRNDRQELTRTIETINAKTRERTADKVEGVSSEWLVTVVRKAKRTSFDYDHGVPRWMSRVSHID